MKKIVIVGATSAIAEHCARLWLAEPVALVLVGRDAARLEGVAADLRVRSPASAVHVMCVDFSSIEAVAECARQAAAGEKIDVVLIAHGNLPDQKQCQDELAMCRDALLLNGVSVALFAEAFAAELARQGLGTLAVIGSVAGDRGRKSNYVYGAAKGMVERYVQGLQHRFASTGVRVCLIKPGPTDTPMTAHLKGGGMALARVEDVAARIVKGVASGTPLIYAPGKWRLIMLVIRHLPGFVFNRMDI